jgi:hypothetical protein
VIYRLASLAGFLFLLLSLCCSALLSYEIL